MKVVLLAPPRRKNVPVMREYRCEHLSTARVDTPATLLQVASQLRQDGHDVTLIDANANNFTLDDLQSQLRGMRYDCAVIALAHFMLEADLKSAELVKRMNPATRTMGISWHCRHHAQHILDKSPALDMLITGNPLSVMAPLLRSLVRSKELDNIRGLSYGKDDRVVTIEGEGDRVRLDELPPPAYDLLASFDPYYIVDPLLSPYALVYSGQGCPYRCNYCCVAGTPYSSKSADQLLEELRILVSRGVRYVCFHDEVFTLNRRRTLEICQRMIDEDLWVRWFCDTRVDLVDRELLMAMRKAGCIGLSYGVESGSQEILDAMRKGCTVEQAENALRWTKRAHIPIKANLMLGYVGESQWSVSETKAFVHRTMPDMVKVAGTGILPGTELARIALQKGWNGEGGNGLDEIENQFKVDVPAERREIMNVLREDPRWWASSLRTLIYNPELVLGLCGVFARSLERKASRMRRRGYGIDGLDGL